MKKLVLILGLLLPFLGMGQNLLGEVFEGCVTDRFVVESDSVTIKPIEDLIEIFAENIEFETLDSLRGVLAVQVIVDPDGRSCLLSAENNTNIASPQLFLKETIDDYLFFQRPRERTSVIFAMNFMPDGVEVLRIGVNQKQGFHPID